MLLFFLQKFDLLPATDVKQVKVVTKAYNYNHLVNTVATYGETCWHQTPRIM
jgi:hypothetical protein